jgi:hypothetical protein
MKLSGLMSLCKNDFEWTYSILLISWSASSRTVFTVNFLEQKLNKSSRDGPSNWGHINAFKDATRRPQKNKNKVSKASFLAIHTHTRLLPPLFPYKYALHYFLRVLLGMPIEV